MSSWGELPEGARATLDQEWRGVTARDLPSGAAVASAEGVVVAAGRNRVYDPVTAEDPLEGTALAHAELNALARVPHGDLGALTLWSTQRPCAMCAAAIGFVGVGRVRYLAEDPSTAARSESSFDRRDDPVWSRVAAMLFLYTGAVLRGEADGNLVRQAETDAALARAVLGLANGDRLGNRARSGEPLSDVGPTMLS